MPGVSAHGLQVQLPSVSEGLHHGWQHLRVDVCQGLDVLEGQMPHCA